MFSKATVHFIKTSPRDSVLTVLLRTSHETVWVLFSLPLLCAGLSTSPETLHFLICKWTWDLPRLLSRGVNVGCESIPWVTPTHHYLPVFPKVLPELLAGSKFCGHTHPAPAFSWGQPGLSTSLAVRGAEVTDTCLGTVKFLFWDVIKMSHVGVKKVFGKGWKVSNRQSLILVTEKPLQVLVVRKCFLLQQEERRPFMFLPLTHKVKFCLVPLLPVVKNLIPHV